MVKNLFFEGSGYNTALRDAIALLNEIPADLPYPDWFRVAAALKNARVEFKVFDQWSQTAPDKYDADKAKQVWGDVGANDKPKITLSTLHFIAARYNGTVVPAPFEMLPQPKTELEQATQIAEYLELMFHSGEIYELVTNFFLTGKGKKCPDRSKSIIAPRDESELTDENMKILASYATCTEGALISLNPLKKLPQGKTPTDDDVTDYRHALIEADELSKEEQWQKLRELNLPILAVVWSGGKSLHAIVKIDAGNDRELYKKRVELLHDYLKEKGFPADSANKNPSRLTRLPGVRRGNDMQYMVSGSWGHPDWHSFEKYELAHNKVNTTFSPEAATEKALEEEYGQPLFFKKSGEVKQLNQNFFAEFTKQEQQLIYSEGNYWQYEKATGLWTPIRDDQIAGLIAEAMRRYGRLHNVNLVQQITAANCKAIKTFIAPEKENLFCRSRGKFIHTANGMLKFSDDGNVTLKPYSKEFYSRNRCEINYAPDAECPRFINELLKPALDDDDIEVLQLYSGQCLLADNLTQTFMVITGTAGGGKGTLVKIIESVIGFRNCTELRTEQLGERFESSRFIGKSLLVGSDVPSNFLLSKHVGHLKSLCGHDLVTAEVKGKQDGVELEGRFNIIITANDRPRVNLDGDAQAWLRRILLIPFEKPAVQERIPDFDKVLLKEEGPGILNWMIQGAIKLITNGIPEDVRARQRVEQLLRESDSVHGFLSTEVEKVTDTNCAITCDELHSAYEQWCSNNDWHPLPSHISYRKLRDEVSSLYNVSQAHDINRASRTLRGYHGLRFKKLNQTPVVQTAETAYPELPNMLNNCAMQRELF